MAEEVKRLGSLIEDSNIKKQEIDTNFGKVIAYIQGNKNHLIFIYILSIAFLLICIFRKLIVAGYVFCSLIKA